MEDLPPTFLRSFEREEERQEGRHASGDAPGYVHESREEGLEPVREDWGEEFWFVLEQLYKACEQERLIGREGILKAARARRFPISQKEVRDLLTQMEAEGLVKVTRGRGGSRITENGQRMWENRKKQPIN